MKKLKKVLLLGLTLAMSATLFAACGGKGGDGGDDLGGGNIQGEQFADAEAWVQALEDTAAANNATISMKIKGEERMGEFFEKGEYVITAKVAEDKVYVYEKTDASWYYEEDGVVDRDEEHDEDQTYFAMVDGVATKYFKELEQDWQISEWHESDFSATVGFVLDWYAEFNLTYVSDMYEQFTNNNGTYSCTLGDEGDQSTAKLKFVDGQLAWGKISENTTYRNGATGVWEVVFAITYGGAEIGALPGQEPDGGESSESGSAGGEVGGGAVADEAAWNAALSPSGDYLYTQSENGVELVRYEIDGDTVHILQEDLEKYYAIEEGKYYFYEKVEDQAWTKTEITQESYNQYVGYARMDWAMMFPYSAFTYDEASDTYKAESIFAGITLSNVAIKIADGKLAEMTYTMEGITCTLRYTYQDVTLTLPEIDNVGD